MWATTQTLQIFSMDRMPICQFPVKIFLSNSNGFMLKLFITILHILHNKLSTISGHSMSNQPMARKLMSPNFFKF